MFTRTELLHCYAPVVNFPGMQPWVVFLDGKSDVGWLGFNVARQLWLWATQQDGNPNTFLPLKVLLVYVKISTDGAHALASCRRMARLSNVYLLNIAGILDRGKNSQHWAQQADALATELEAGGKGDMSHTLAKASPTLKWYIPIVSKDIPTTAHQWMKCNFIPLYFMLKM